MTGKGGSAIVGDLAVSGTVYCNLLRGSIPFETKTGTSAGVPGQVAMDATNLYVCIALNTWKKITLVAI